MEELLEHAGLVSAGQFKAAVVHSGKGCSGCDYGNAHYQCDQVQDHQIGYLTKDIHQRAVDRKYLHLCLPRFI